MRAKVFKAIRREELVGEVRKGEGGFLELIELFDKDDNSVVKSPSTHPESYFTFTYMGVEYFSLPHSNRGKPVYHRII